MAGRVSAIILELRLGLEGSDSEVLIPRFKTAESLESKFLKESGISKLSNFLLKSRTGSIALLGIRNQDS